MTNFRVLVLDANVLTSWVERTIYIDLATSGVISLYWSDAIESELQHRALPEMGKTPEQIETIMADLHRALPDACVTPRVGDYAGTSQVIDVPDRDDLAVLAAALAVDADFIVTKNVSDFSREMEQRFGLRIAHSAQMLAALGASFPEEMNDAVQFAREVSGSDLRAHFKRAGLASAEQILDDDASNLAGSADVDAVGPSRG